MASTRQFFEGLFEKKVLGRHVAQHDPALRAYLRDIQHIALLEPGEETRLLTRALQGDQQAWHRLIEANLRLVVLIASRFQ
ncbi:MAG TPA: sigma-70 factor domain-containing protein [Ktedonobacteraceae bacterium]|nr:sigma-70 factor domain-containing protein [Ktedonobacteraceae bacterium]